MLNKIAQFIIFISAFINIYSCQNTNKKTNNNAQEKVIDTLFSEESIFNLKENWHTQNNQSITLSALKGKVLVIVMIYTSCKAACPRLVADMRDIESRIPADKLNKLNFGLVSIDPETDNPARLKAFAIANNMNAKHWTFLQGTKNGVLVFANVLSVKYKQISPIDFSHANIISVFNTKGELIHQQEGLGVNNLATVQTILQLVNQ